MTSELNTLNVASQCDGLHVGMANKRRMSPEDLSPPPTPISPARSPATLVTKLDNTQASFEVRLDRKIFG